MNDDLYLLWVAAHDYLIAQTSEDATQISAAYTNLVAQHNRIHGLYFAELDQAPQVAGV